MHIGGISATSGNSNVNSLNVNYTAGAGHLCILTVAVTSVSGTIPGNQVVGTNGMSMPLITDTAGTVWEFAVCSPNGPGNASSGSGFNYTANTHTFIFYAKNSVAGANTITITLPGDPGFMMACLDEYSGFSTTFPLDVFNIRDTETGGTSVSGNITTHGTGNELLYAVLTNFDTGGHTSTNLFTQRETAAGVTIVPAQVLMSTWDKEVSSPGTYNASFSNDVFNNPANVYIVSFSQSALNYNLVQQQVGFELRHSGTGTGSCVLKFPVNNTPGNQLVAIVRNSSGLPVSTAGDSWIQVLGVGAPDTYVYRAQAIGGANTVTFGTTGTVILYEFDATQTNTQTNFRHGTTIGGDLTTDFISAVAGDNIVSVCDGTSNNAVLIEKDTIYPNWIYRGNIFYDGFSITGTATTDLGAISAVQIAPSTTLYQEAYTHCPVNATAVIFGVSGAPQLVLVITADNQTKQFGTLFVFNGTEFTNTALQPGDSITSCTITSTGSPPDAPVGSYPILISNAIGVGLDKYIITYVPGTMVVVGGGGVCYLVDYPEKGPYMDASGKILSNGYILIRLVFDCNCPCADYQITANNHARINLDANGMVSGSPKIRPNDQLKPDNSYYIVEIFSQYGQLAYGPKVLRVLS